MPSSIDFDCSSYIVQEIRRRKISKINTNQIVKVLSGVYYCADVFAELVAFGGHSFSECLGSPEETKSKFQKVIHYWRARKKCVEILHSYDLLYNGGVVCVEYRNKHYILDIDVSIEKGLVWNRLKEIFNAKPADYESVYRFIIPVATFKETLALFTR